MTREHLIELILNLSESYNFFVSEKQFQIALSEQIKQSLNDSIVINEFPYSFNGKNQYLDIAIMNNKNIALELKYITTKKAEQADLYVNKFCIPNIAITGNSPWNKRINDIYHDIDRLENINKNSSVQFAHRFFVLLVGNAEFWEKDPKNSTTDKDFCLCNGHIIHGKFERTPKNNKNKWYSGEIEGTYICEWVDTKFKINDMYLKLLVIEIKM